MCSFSSDRRLAIFYDLLLYNNLTETFRPFYGYSPMYELEFVNDGLGNEPKGDLDLNLLEQEDNVYSLNSLAEVPAAAESIHSALGDALDSDLTYEDTQYSVVGIVNLIVVGYVFTSSARYRGRRRLESRQLD